ncbi:MAG TPA: GAP family protein [Candidatus Bilamarchaeum sp.]|nr:GAP family protein [Candidatus Bilamarchaeum sp.]
MAVDASLPQLGTVLVTAAIDSINPCAIGVMILLVALMASNSELRKRLLFYGGIYVAAVYVTYLLAGLGLILFLSVIPLWTAQYISVAVGVIVVLGALVEIKDFFWYGEGISLSIPAERSKDIKRMMQNINPLSMIILGAFVAGVELPCTGGPYLAITLVLSQNFNLAAFGLLLIYNVIFVAPLLAILGATLIGVKVSDMQMWKQANRANMRLAIGILLVLLGWLLMLIANGTINLG